MAIICQYTNRIDNGTYRIHQDGDIVVNNADPTMYITVTIDNVRYKLYNSAIYVSGQHAWYMFLTINGTTNYGSYTIDHWSGSRWDSGVIGTCTKYNNFYSMNISKRIGYICSSDANDIIKNGEFRECIVPVFTNYNDYLTYITNPIPWKPVASIIGNNKIYTLAKIALSDINNADPVSGASSATFDVLTDESLVSSLVLDVQPSGDSAIVSYSVPGGVYEYVKLVYKKDEAPEDVDDGTVIDISQTDTRAVASGLDYFSTYYFVIFTDKTQSEPVSIKTPLAPEYNVYIKRMNEPDDGYGFWWNDYTGELPVWDNYDSGTLKEGYSAKPVDGMDWSKHSYYWCYYGNYDEFNKNGSEYTPYWMGRCVFTSTNVLVLNIVSNGNDSYTGTISGANNFMNQVWQYKTSPSGSWSNKMYLHLMKKNDTLAYSTDTVSRNSNPPDMTRTGTLTYVLGQFAAYFRNIKVVVDGVVWADPAAQNT